MVHVFGGRSDLNNSIGGFDPGGLIVHVQSVCGEVIGRYSSRSKVCPKERVLVNVIKSEAGSPCFLMTIRIFSAGSVLLYTDIRQCLILLNL